MDDRFPGLQRNQETYIQTISTILLLLLLFCFNSWSLFCQEAGRLIDHNGRSSEHLSGQDVMNFCYISISG